MKYYDDVPTKQSLRNAKEEFLEFVGGRDILCAMVRIDYEDVKKGAYLPVDHTQEWYLEFLNNIDLPYTPYGEEMLDGTIWYKDGSWSSRDGNVRGYLGGGEYDVDYFWVDHEPIIPSEIPEIPEDLLGV